MTDTPAAPTPTLLDTSRRVLGGPRGAVLAGCAYVALSGAWVLVLGVGTALAMLAYAMPRMDGLDPQFDMGSLVSLVPGWVLGLSTLVQFAGLGAIAAALVWLAGWPVAEAFAIRRAHPSALAAGVLGGLVVGMFPGWIAERLMELVPRLDGGNLEMINKALVEGDLVGRVGMIFAVCVLAPVIEELIFRGFLFRAAERASNRWGAWVVSSVLFASYHVDPVHVIAVLFTGFFLGWLRLRSGSIWPGMIAHAANNSLAATIALVVGAEKATETGMGFLPSFVAALATLAMAGVATIGEPDASPKEVAPTPAA